MQFLDFNFVTTSSIRKIKDEHRIISQAMNKEVGFSSQQHPVTLVFDAPHIFIAFMI